MAEPDDGHRGRNHAFRARTSRGPRPSRARRSCTPARRPPRRSALGSPRRMALDAALEEIAAGHDVPSTQWRRELVAAARARAPAQRGRAASRRRHDAQPAPGRRALRHAHGAAGRAPRSAPPTATAAPAPPRCWPSTTTTDEIAGGRRRGGRGRARAHWTRSTRTTTTRTRTSRRRPRLRRAADDDDEVTVWERPDETDEDVDAALIDDPNAHKRFWFEHATGAGKTVAAMGFVEASRTGGVLILTHRRNLVDQFNGELRDRGYADRVSAALLRRGQGPRRRAR